MNQDQHVLIAGAGIGGLCLAQGLRRAGISCAVYESAPGLAWGGYLLHLNADGGTALRRCLPERQYDSYVATSRRSPRRDLVVVLDPHGDEITTIPHLGPPNDPVTPHTSVHRRTLCQILLDGVADIVHFGHEVRGFRHAGNEVVLDFTDGRQARGTMVVGADGINSVIRRQLLPAVQVVPLVEHVLLTQAPLTAELAGALPSAFQDSFVMIRDAAGTHLAAGLFQPRQPISAPMDPVGDYVGVNLELTSGPPGFFTADGEVLHSLMRQAVADWHPSLRLLVDQVAPATIVPRTIRMLSPAEPWPSGEVTLLGDAIHAMPPKYGHGANSALQDAAELTAALASGRAGAVADYEAAMRARTFPLLRNA